MLFMLKHHATTEKVVPFSDKTGTEVGFQIELPPSSARVESRVLPLRADASVTVPFTEPCLFLDFVWGIFNMKTHEGQEPICNFHLYSNAAILSRCACHCVGVLHQSPLR